MYVTLSSKSLRLLKRDPEAIEVTFLGVLASPNLWRHIGRRPHPAAHALVAKFSGQVEVRQLPRRGLILAFLSSSIHENLGTCSLLLLVSYSSFLLKKKENK